MELKMQELVLFVKSGYRSDEDILRLSTRVQWGDFYEALKPLIENIRLAPDVFAPVIKVDVEGTFTERHKRMLDANIPDDIEYIVSAKGIENIRYDKSNRGVRLPITNAITLTEVENEDMEQNIIIYSKEGFCETIEGSRFHSRFKTNGILAEFKSMLENIKTQPDFYAKHINIYIQGLYTDRLKKIGFEKLAKEVGVSVGIKARGLDLMTRLPIENQKQDLLPLNEEEGMGVKKLEPVIIVSTDPTFMNEIGGRSVIRYRDLDSDISHIEFVQRLREIIASPDVSKDCVHIYSDSPEVIGEVDGCIVDLLPAETVLRLCGRGMFTEFFKVEYVPEADIKHLVKLNYYEDMIFSNPFVLKGKVDRRYREVTLPGGMNENSHDIRVSDVGEIEVVETIKDRTLKHLLKFLPSAHSYHSDDKRPVGLVIHSNKVHINADLLGTKYYKLPVSGFNADNLNSLLLATCEENAYDYVVLVDDKLSEEHVLEIIDCLQYVTYSGTILYNKQENYFFKRKNIRNKMWESMELTTKETDCLSDMLRDIKFEENLDDFPLG